MHVCMCRCYSIPNAEVVCKIYKIMLMMTILIIMIMIIMMMIKRRMPNLMVQRPKRLM